MHFKKDGRGDEGTRVGMAWEGFIEYEKKISVGGGRT